MPFGLSNAPCTFQRMMNCVLRGLAWQCCLVYLDDIIIYSLGSFGRHLVEAALVFERLAQAGLTLKAKKRVFGAKRIEYLGHQLGEEGVRPVDRLVKAVCDFPVPRDPQEVRQFVHLAGYYRKFIPGFGGRMSPLTRLLRKAVEWQWGQEQEETFCWVKALLTRRPVLAYPDFRRPFVVATDASLVGVGAALMQNHGQGLQPVAYTPATPIALHKRSIPFPSSSAWWWYGPSRFLGHTCTGVDSRS